MTSLNSTLSISKQMFNEEFADPAWHYCLDSVFTPIVISSFYVWFVRKIGPRMMRNRQPFSINKIIAIYNVIQVIFNFYLCTKTYKYLYFHKETIFCLLPETSESEMYKPAKILTKLFFFNKTADLLDTIFFVLKKKDSHVTFLHLYHHLLTFLGSWFVVHYIPGGGLAFFGFINAFVHSIMYGYYLISSLSLNKTIVRALKKPVTQLQLLQFGIVGVYGINMMMQPSCVIPSVLKYLGYFGLSQTLLMLILFTNFYRQAYVKNVNHSAEYNKEENGKVRSD